jgi:arginyl-tRNA synthetase
MVAAAVAKVLPEAAQAEFQVEPPRQAEHGDFAVNAAMVFAKIARSNPRKLAEQIVAKLEDPDKILDKVEIAGPGFLNVRLAKDVWHRELKAVWDEKERFGRSDAGKGQRTMVEFVSANPTGPMHVGHGRGAVIGDVVANLLDWAGYTVAREFYINDAGGQVWRLAHAVLARASELKPGVPRVELDPEDYQGEYIKDVSQAWLDQGGDPTRPFAEIREALRAFATTWILENLIKKDLQLFGIRFDVFFSEKKLHDEHRLEAAIKVLDEKGMTAVEVLPPP